MLLQTFQQKEAEKILKDSSLQVVTTNCSMKFGINVGVPEMGVYIYVCVVKMQKVHSESDFCRRAIDLLCQTKISIQNRPNLQQSKRTGKFCNEIETL